MTTISVLPVLMAGGSGTRLWPLSRAQYPKQFLVLHGNRSYVLCDDDGQITETHSVSAGLDYPGVGPEHAWLKDTGRARYLGITDDEALAAFHELALTEGIIPALESAHAVAQAMKMAPQMPKDAILLVNLSGRGDKDMHTVAERAGKKL